MKKELTEREKEVLELVMQGLTNEEIAEKLFVEPVSIRSRLRNIYAKKGILGRKHKRLELFVMEMKNKSGSVV